MKNINQLSLKDKIVKTIVITNNFNTNIHFLNFHDFKEKDLIYRDLYIGSKIFCLNKTINKTIFLDMREMGLGKLRVQYLSRSMAAHLAIS